jgi:hypothetical protein
VVTQDRLPAVHFGPVGSFERGSVLREVNNDGVIPAYGVPRAMSAAGERVDVKAAVTRFEKRAPAEWQARAWAYYESIGEVNYGLGQIGSIISRVRLYAGVVERPDDPPRPAIDVLRDFDEKGLEADTTKFVLEEAMRLVEDLSTSAPSLMREMTINLSVAGEGYLVHLTPDVVKDQEDASKWVVASSDGLTQGTNGYRLRLDRTQSQGDIALPEDAYIARIWRSNPRYVREPESSMIGVLDACDLRLLIDQTIRAMLRRRLNAGVIFVPNGLQAIVIGAGGEVTVADALAKMAIEPVGDESAAYSVVPLVITGDPEMGKILQRINFVDPVDESIVTLGDRTLERILQGLDIPKELVTGVANLRYSNAIVLDDNLYRRSVEPTVLLIVDALTSAYLRPMLKRSLINKLGATEDQAIAVLKAYDDLLRKIVMWFDPSQVVTRPDKSTAADIGYSNHILSGEAWRTARGFGNGDAPTEEELRTRMTIEKAPIPPDMAAAMIEGIDPIFWKKAKRAAAAESEQPEELQQMLEGGEPEIEQSAREGEQTQGGEVSPGGFNQRMPRPTDQAEVTPDASR